MNNAAILHFEDSEPLLRSSERVATEPIDVVVIGAGQAGLAAGYYLRQRGIPFVIVDGCSRIGDRWRNRWDSLRLFTPARFDGLPGLRFPASRNAFPTKDETADYLESYATRFDLPVRTKTRVQRVSREGDRYSVRTATGTLLARHVIVAMAPYQEPRVPAFARELRSSIVQLHSHAYRRPAQLDDGPVLVVGAGNSGAEIAIELAKTVVHRRLLGAGCLQQIVLADSAQCAAALASPDLRPELAGSSYLLVPVSAPGAFHPKIHLLLGKKSGKVLVGSHNLTFAGFGGNAEITNLITIEPRDRGSVAVARAALDAIRAWTRGQPALIEECLKAAEDAAPWLRGPTPTDARELLLWSAPGTTPSLWEQLRGHLRGRCARITVLGPFFDDELAFLRRLLDDLHPAELVVGIDPASSKISVAQARRLKNVRFVDARGVLAVLAGRTIDSEDDSVPPLHAKILWIEGDERELLVTGSANPSRPAWLDTRSNAEAILVRIDPDAAILENLALARLHDAPEISAADWQLVEERVDTASETTRDTQHVVVAVADGETIVIRGVPKATDVASVVVHTRDHGVFDDLSWARVEDTLTLTASAEAVEASSLVELRGAASSFAIVHHAPRLRTGTGSSGVQRELRTALGAMTADPAQLGNVMQIVEKAIFDEDGVRFRKGELHAPPSREAPAGAPLGDLSISLEEVKRRRGARKSIAERNLAVVLDLLIHRLGQGLHDEVAPTTPEVEEKDLEPVEPEAPPNEPPADPIDGEALLRACHRKVKKLLTRMSERLARLDGSAEAAASAVAQLAAVVGVLRWLRRSDPTFAWLPKGESVVPEDARNQFFWDVAGHFATPAHT